MGQIEPVGDLIVRNYVDVSHPGEVSRDAAQAVSGSRCYTFGVRERLVCFSAPEFVLFSEAIGADSVIAALS